MSKERKNKMAQNNGQMKLCAHGVCICHAEEGSDYCGTYCAQAGEITNVTVDENQKRICDCGHPACGVQS